MSKVLVVEDNPVIRQTFKDVLEFLEVDVITSDNSLFALSLVETYQNSLSLITLDLNMPEMDGITFMQELQRRAGYNPRLLEIPVVVISAYYGGLQYQMLRELGVKELFTKPLSISTWDTIIDTYALKKSLSEVSRGLIEA